MRLPAQLFSNRYRHPSLGDYSRYTWCSTCQTVQLTERWEDNSWTCPNSDCNANMMEAWRWEEARQSEPSFPQHPILGRVYKLYNFDWEAEPALGAATSSDVSDEQHVCAT